MFDEVNILSSHGNVEDRERRKEGISLPWWCSVLYLHRFPFTDLLPHGDAFMNVGLEARLDRPGSGEDTGNLTVC